MIKTLLKKAMNKRI